MSIILTKQGQLCYMHDNGFVSIVTSDIVSDEGLPPSTLTMLTPAPGENHIVTTFQYYPSNTQMDIYRFDNGFHKVLSIIGDQGIHIDGTHICKYWKKYRDQGGWDQVVTTYVWDDATKAYKEMGTKPTEKLRKRGDAKLLAQVES